MRKFLFLILMLAMFIPLQAQVLTEAYNTNDLFDGTYWEDLVTESVSRYNLYDISLGTISGLTATTRTYYVTSVDSAADTIYTKLIQNKAFGDHWVSVAVVSDSATDGGVRANPDTIYSVLEMGVFRGHGTVPGTAGGSVDDDGLIWKHLVTVTQDTSIGISLADSTWWTDYSVPFYFYRWRETTEQSNKYYMTDSQFKEE